MMMHVLVKQLDMCPFAQAYPQALIQKTCCFLCDRTRDSKGNKQLVLIAMEHRQQSGQNKARELNDNTILTKIDKIAADFEYHRSCMTRFMNHKKSVSGTLTHSPQFTVSYNGLLEDLLSEITDPLMKHTAALYVTQLRDCYRNLFTERGVANSNTYKSNRLQNRPKFFFGSDIQIIQQRGRPSIVCSSYITVAEMVVTIT